MGGRVGEGRKIRGGRGVGGDEWEEGRKRRRGGGGGEEEEEEKSR